VSADYTWQLPRDSTAPGQARWHMRELFANDREAVDAELVVSELVTNAWKHGHGEGPITLNAQLRNGGVRLEVCGAANGEPRVETDSDSSSGRGLLLIDGLAQAWGHERRGELVCVWAEIALA